MSDSVASPSPVSPLTPADLEAIAGAERLLVAMDFDGTLAHFSDEPRGVRAVDGAIDALVELADCPDTQVMVISGRTMEQLTEVTELPADGPVLLVGSHGAEPSARAVDANAANDVGAAIQLSADQRQLLGALADKAEALAAEHPGAWVEYKPAAVGLHTRKVADRFAARAAAEELKDFAAKDSNSHITDGKDILEVAVVSTTKGGFVDDFRKRHDRGDTAPLRVLFAGDDTTDETVLSRLTSEDLGVRVGGGDTAATRNLETPEDVRDMLRQLLDLRAQRA